MYCVYDIETLRGLFLYVEKDLSTGKFAIFKIGRYHNDLASLVTHLLESKCEYAVSYNGLSFDAQVLQFILENYLSWQQLSGLKVADNIYQFAQDRIDDAKYRLPAPYKEKALWKKQIDLIKIHNFDSEGRRCSLKWLEYSMDFPTIEELEIDFRRRDFSLEEIEKIVSYCINDVLATERLYEITRGNTSLEEYAGKDKIQDRFDLIAEYNLPIAAVNWSDVKIGESLNKLEYCRLSGLGVEEVYQLKLQQKREPFTFGDCIPGYVAFRTKQLQSFYMQVKDEPVLLNKEQEFKVTIEDTTYTIRKGGIHSTEKKRMLVAADGELYIDADVGSQYPNAIVKRQLYPAHLGRRWLINYEKTISRRLEYKAKSQDISLSEPERRKYAGLAEFLKLALNGGGFGMTNKRSNWQYDPRVHFSCTIGNQFEMLMLIESLTLAGIHVVSANTDGIVCRLSKTKEKEYYRICAAWEQTVGNSQMGKLEYTYYSKMIQTSVNDYLAVKTNGSIKRKGDFSLSNELHKNKSRRIIPIALEQYLLSGIPVAETITQHPNLFDFCIGVKSTRDFHYEAIDTRTGATEKYHRIIRYYVSTSGRKLLKVRNDADPSSRKGRQQCEAGYWLSTIVNTCNDTGTAQAGICYDYYIHKCNEILHGLQEIAREKKNKHKATDPGQLSIF